MEIYLDGNQLRGALPKCLFRSLYFSNRDLEVRRYLASHPLTHEEQSLSLQLYLLPGQGEWTQYPHLGHEVKWTWDQVQTYKVAILG